MDKYCKRLIEVYLPIRRISEHSRREKNLRKGHPWHLHIWWARRPWGACRAVALATILPAPTDDCCPDSFVNAAYEILSKIFNLKDRTRNNVQEALIKFIGEFASWELGKDPIFVNAAKRLVQASYKNESVVVLDPFAGYGAIPGEATRLGCESIASDLNPVAILCLRSLLEYAPKYGHELLEKVREGAEFIKDEAKNRLSKYYPTKKRLHPIAWLWARTVICEGPGCGALIPLISQNVISKGRQKTWVTIEGESLSREINVHIMNGEKIPDNLTKTAGGGHALCPVCGFTTNKEKVKAQGKAGKIGNKLYGVALAKGQRMGKKYAASDDEDLKAYSEACRDWQIILNKNNDIEITEKFPLTYGLHVPPHYGIKTWGDLFSPRQKLALHTIGEIISEYHTFLVSKDCDKELARDVATILALSVSNIVHYSTNMSTWLEEHMISCFITGNAIAMRWDWAEANPLIEEYVGGLEFSFNNAISAIQSCLDIKKQTTVMKANATDILLPDNSVDMYFTDPPYYDVVPYADLSDLCYVWLKRFLSDKQSDLFSEELTPKKCQIVVNPYQVEDGRGDQSSDYYQKRMELSFKEGLRVLKPNGIGAIVFAHKGTSAWEVLLSSILNSGFKITASWPIDTERQARMRAHKSATLGSSIHLIVRPREIFNQSQGESIGDWRDILSKLHRCIHEWLPKLASEGIVGADAIFACLGPALEIFSRYSSVEKASGEKVLLKEYLEEVWASIAREALNMIFEGADASGFEEDARLTAMWLWTLRTTFEEGEEIKRNVDEKAKSLRGYNLEYDAARKIAQGLGVHLENLSHLVAIKGDTTTLLTAGARTRYLFGKDAAYVPKGRKKKLDKQMKLNFEEELKELEEESGDWAIDFSERAGSTVLDQLHQCMILFGAGRGEALRRFLVDDAMGHNPLFWRLAQALSALYPTGTDEKRWLDGVLARKKGLGF